MDKKRKKTILSRTAQIFSLFLKHGFGHLLETGQRRRAALDLSQVGSSGDRNKGAPFTHWERIRLLLEELGPTFIKMGQVFSNRPDLLPEELLVELRKLQDNAPVFPSDVAIALLEQELGRPFSEVFTWFEPEPVASASIAQVHKALMKNGQMVAIKIQRPRIREIIETDLEILYPLGALVEKLILRSDVIDTQGIIKEFGKTIAKELDFKNEALFLEKFKSNFKDDPDIYVPEVYKKLSTRHILIMEFISGINPLNINGLKEAGLDPKLVAQKGANSILKQIFIHGFFHADPHPGNILILPDGRICFLDFGMMGVIFDRHRQRLAGMLLAIALSDAPALSKNLLELALNTDSAIADSLEEDVFTLMETYSHLPLKDINLTEFLSQATLIILEHKLQMPPSLYLLLKALITIEGLARQLDGDFDMLSSITPFVQNILTDKLNVLKTGGKGIEASLEYISLASEMPGHIRDVLKQLKKGRLNMQIDPTTMEELFHRADKITNRIAFALIVTGGVMASSMALQSKIPPLWNDIPIFAIVGYVGSAIFGLALLISIWRTGRF